MTLVCYCGATEPCYGGPCRFVDADAIVPLNAWIEAAESIRLTCGNLEEFDLLIVSQKKRRADLW